MTTVTTTVNATDRKDNVETSNSNTIMVVILVSSLLFVLLLVIVLFLVVRMRRRVEVVEVGRNDLYGTYEEGAVYSTVEDANPYYAEQDEMGVERSRATDRNSQYGY